MKESLIQSATNNPANDALAIAFGLKSNCGRPWEISCLQLLDLAVNGPSFLPGAQGFIPIMEQAGENSLRLLGTLEKNKNWLCKRKVEKYTPKPQSHCLDQKSGHGHSCLICKYPRMLFTMIKRTQWNKTAKRSGFKPSFKTDFQPPPLFKLLFGYINQMDQSNFSVLIKLGLSKNDF